MRQGAGAHATDRTEPDTPPTLISPCEEPRCCFRRGGGGGLRRRGRARVAVFDLR